MSKFSMGDYTQCYCGICEVVCDGEILFNVATDDFDKVVAVLDENEQLKQSIKEIDDAELHLKQIILKRIDDYIWEWEDEGTPVAQVLRELRDEIKGDDVE